MDYKDMNAGEFVKARYSYDHGKIEAGKDYGIAEVHAPYYAGNGFTFPAYVTVKLGNGKTYTSHTHHYEKA